MDDRPWHIITCEYPPQIGGVADYSFQVARALTDLGRTCFVWAPGQTKETQASGKLVLYRQFGRFGLKDICNANQLWIASKHPKQILLQWSPTGYGLKSSNLPFCLWLTWRVIRGDQLSIVVHEAFLQLWEGPLRRRAAAFVQRLMTILLLNSATRIFVATSALLPVLRPFCVRKTEIATQAIPSNILPCADPEAVLKLKRSISPLGAPLIGHFGLYSPNVARLLIPSLLELLKVNPRARILLIGAGSEQYQKLIVQNSTALALRIQSTGPCSKETASTHISACDVMFQPYLDGISTRRGTTMAALAHGRCLVSNVGANTEEFWKSESPVYLVKSREPLHMACAIEEILSSPYRATELGRKGLQLYQQKFALSHTIDALIGTSHL